MLGKLHTDEAKAKISVTSAGRKDTPETTAKRKASQAKRMMPKEREEQIISLYNAKVNIRDICEQVGVNTSGVYRVLKRNNINPSGGNRSANKGKKHSEESKKKMSEAMKKSWEKKNTGENKE